MKFTPRLDFVIVQMEAPAEQTKNGILLPASVREERTPGVVIAIGPGHKSEYTGEWITIKNLEKGDRVLFNKFSALELDEDERFYLIRHTDIGCVISDDE
jgi:co-chaperonin GroES (HSP10)